MDNRSVLLILAGPTAVGKTALSLQLARHFQAPVISADSRQCYKYMDIGTDKIPPEIQAEIPHYHISCLFPDEPNSASNFYSSVQQWRLDIEKSQKPVIVAGGSTLYIQALIHPLDQLPPKNPVHLLELENKAKQSGLQSIRRLLEKVDPVYARRIDGLNPHRMFRALDVWMQTGKPFSSFHHHRSIKLPPRTLLCVLDRDRNELHQGIEKRTASMLNRGLLRETQDLLDKGYSPKLQSLQTVGYRESLSFLRGEITRDELKEKITVSTRQYARRQLTWFRRWPDVHWCNLTKNGVKKVREEIISEIERLAAEK